ncbi:uncharacterized protein LY89DRAFT_251644 [Mollisia scopiformis]|uniref:Uncharacterized protein n=1 Tax=Mollisia scopiformis TaxID=149040 RepID=A0A194WSC4_MOLSC|nr:uncharacterized protein LY89DRAFT_251644 [Mollisia scopiformis]KUJ10866.1 hypothetical protein LY89DRAFT_251644 [Mollisia scopiformis]
MSYQPSVSFPALPTRRTLFPGRPETSLKRGRAPTRSDENQPTLPPHARPKKKCPPLKPSGAFMFKGTNPLYVRTTFEPDHTKMTISCGYPGCHDFPPKLVDRGLQSTNNYRSHYKKYHPRVPVTAVEVLDVTQRTKKSDQLPSEKPVEQQSHDERYRVLLLAFILKNNLSFSLVDQPETRDLISFLSPTTKQVSRKVMMIDMKNLYAKGKDKQQAVFIEQQ